MKRIMAWMLIMVFALSCAVTALAAETELDGENRQTDIGVYAQYIDNTEWNTILVNENGEASTALPDGTEITVSIAAEPGWQLVIDPITDKEAVDWIGGVLDGKAKDLSPLHIYFIDASGNTKAAEGVTVTVKPPKKLTDPMAYSLTSEGKASGLTVAAKDGKITFATDGSPFYILGEKIGGGTSAPSDPGNSPQTGDSTNLWLWVALMLVAAAGLTATLGFRRKTGK